MGRSKAAPKRRRIQSPRHESQISQQEQKALAILQNAPQEVVEQAASEAIRTALPYWDSNLFVQKSLYDDSTTNYTIDNNDETKVNHPSIRTSNKFPGLAIHTQIPQNDFSIFKQLHDLIKEKSRNNMTSWSGSISDPRRRAFGFLPQTLGYNETIRNSFLDISTPGKVSNDEGKYNNSNSTTNHDANLMGNGDDKDTKEKEQERNKDASVMLSPEEIPKGFNIALDRLLTYFQSCLDITPGQKRRHAYLTRKNLIAAQPNLHCGRHLLPAHVDHPLKDGFGIFIITLAIRGGGATVFLEDSSQTQKGCFRLHEGQGYMLSGFVRNACTHGVLADDSNVEEDSHNDDKSDSNSKSDSNGKNEVKGKSGAFRESLNLRFGLHGWSEDDPSPIEVLKHWGNSFDEK